MKTHHMILTLMASLLCQVTALQSSSSSSSEISSPIDFDQACTQVGGQLSAVTGLLTATTPTLPLLIINQLPCTLSEPGNYTVLKNLNYLGNGAAITVTANNVSLNFRNHTLTLSNAQAIGILAENVSEFSLENNIVQGAMLTGVHLNNVSKASINNFYALNNPQGAVFTSCDDVQLFNSQFSGTTGVVVNSTSNMSIDSCTFSGKNTGYGLQIQDASKDVVVKNSNFTNYISSLLIGDVEGMLVDHCHATSNSTASQNLVQLGTTTTPANNVIIKNSTFKQSTSTSGFDGILALTGSGSVLENLIIDTQSSDTANGYKAAAIHVGLSSSAPYQNLVANSCIVRGQNSRGVFIENGSKIVLNECQISEASLYNIQMLDATSCLVKKCMIFNANAGIYIDNTVAGGANSIRDSFIYNHTTTGITIADMAKNNVSGNFVYGNETGIDIASSYYTETFFNTSCNNTNNCINVYPNQAPGGNPPGQSAVAGSNLCCSP
ncbi:MAG: right-handed parallel beta-helix repeat-containing protein [Chlamydiales bacterium]|nr:right-handed parallel beta-helix repeat-containing protein [Chlamydiales bacterium]